MSTKLAIVYYSTYGTNLKMAQWAKEAAEKSGAEVRLLKVQELAPQSVIDKQPGWKAIQEATNDIPTASSADLDWADAILFSAPTRFGNLPAQMKQFLDVQGGLWSKGKLANKAISAMTSAQNPHGGQEATILSLYTTMYHWGAIVVAPGYTDDSLFVAGGNPYGTSVSVNQAGEMVEDVHKAVEHQKTRLLEIAGKLK
jgi:NAD(P)H dehydrogenase (quinone)